MQLNYKKIAFLRRTPPEEGGIVTLLSVTTDDETPHDEPLRQIEVGNEWAVPYNPYFSTQFDSHFNAELCSSVKSIPNVIKYVHKG